MSLVFTVPFIGRMFLFKISINKSVKEKSLHIADITIKSVLKISRKGPNYLIKYYL